MFHLTLAGTGTARCKTVRQQQAAFTLIEVVVVIAIIGLATAAILAGVSSMLPDEKDSPREVLRKALDAAWYGSATSHKRYALNYDEEANTLVVRPLSDTPAVSSGSQGSDTGGREADNNGTDADPGVASGADTADVPAAGEGVQHFPFNDDRVTSVTFVRIHDVGNGTLQATTNLTFPRLYFSPWGGCSPAIIEMEIGNEVYRYRLEVFSGALEDIKE